MVRAGGVKGVRWCMNGKKEEAEDSVGMNRQCNENDVQKRVRLGIASRLILHVPAAKTSSSLTGTKGCLAAVDAKRRAPCRAVDLRANIVIKGFESGLKALICETDGDANDWQEVSGNR